MAAVQMLPVSIAAALPYAGESRIAVVDAALESMAAAGWCSAGASRRQIIEASTFEALTDVDGVECPVVLLSLCKQDTATLGADADQVVAAFRDAGWVTVRVDESTWHVHGPHMDRWIAGVRERADRLRAEAMRLITVFAVGEVLPDGRLAFSVPEARAIEAKLDWSVG